jgi:hypothetical protein
VILVQILRFPDHKEIRGIRETKAIKVILEQIRLYLAHRGIKGIKATKVIREIREIKEIKDIREM